MRSLIYFCFILVLGACKVVGDNGSLRNSPPTIELKAVYSADHSAELASAVDWWNYELDADALRVVDQPDYADILITEAPVVGTRSGSGDPRIGMVYIHQPADRYVVYLTIMHELGHVAFWLGHDPDHGCSVMAPDLVDEVSRSWEGSDDWGLPRPKFRHVCLTSHDRLIVLSRLRDI